MENIHVVNPSKIFFTSDLHIGHFNIIKFTGRPYSDVKDMNLSIINNWNEVVSSEDEVFLIGDISWSESSHEFNRLMNKLNGIKHIISGNHDSKKALRNLPDRCFLHDDIVNLWIGNRQFVLSHYPLYTWAGIERGAINLHGHIHSGINSHMGFDTNFTSDRHYDIGIDNNDYRPISFDNLILKISYLRNNGLPKTLSYPF